MRQWFVQVEDGKLARLPNSLRSIVNERRSEEVHSLLIAQAGMMLNEPEKTEISVFKESQMTEKTIVGFSGMMQQIFDWFEAELDDLNDFNFIKLSFVNLRPGSPYDENSLGGKMTTNSPELEGFKITAESVFKNLVKAIGQFFERIGRTTQSQGPEWTTSCDWVSLTLNKSADLL